MGNANVSAGADAARAVRCEGCGATIALTSLSPRVVCGHCQRPQAVPPNLLLELSRHRAGVDQHQTRITAQDRSEHAARLETASNPFSVGALIVAFGPVVVFGGLNELAKVLGAFDAATQSTIDAVVQATTGLWMVLGTAGYIAFRRARAKRIVRANIATQNAGSATCPSCGAPNAFTVGVVVDRCRFCNAAIVAHREAIGHALDQARLAERKARLDRCRAERGGFAIALSSGIEGVIELVLWIVAALMGLAAGYILPLLLLHTEPSLAPYAPFVTLGGWLVGILSATAAFVMIVRTVAKRSALQLAQAELANRIGGKVISHSEAKHWLDAYWAGAFNANDLALSGYGTLIRATVDGFPTLIVMDTGSDRKDRSPNLLVLVASITTPSEPNPIRAKLNHHGLIVMTNDGGVVARASEDTLKKLHAEPTQLLHLAVVPGVMTSFLRGAGADPAPAW